MALEPPRQFALPFLIKSLLKTMQTGPGASEAVSSRYPYEILVKKQCQMALEPPTQFHLHVLIKSLVKAMQNCPGASKALSFTFPY